MTMNPSTDPAETIACVLREARVLAIDLGLDTKAEATSLLYASCCVLSEMGMPCHGVEKQLVSLPSMSRISLLALESEYGIYGLHGESSWVEMAKKVAPQLMEETYVWDETISKESPDAEKKAFLVNLLSNDGDSISTALSLVDDLKSRVQLQILDRSTPSSELRLARRPL